MRDQIHELLDDFSGSIPNQASTPAGKHLMDVREENALLSPDRSEEFHSTVAKILNLKKRARPNIETAVSFLCTRVQQPDTDDWKKLCRVLSYLHNTINDVRSIGCENLKM